MKAIVLIHPNTGRFKEIIPQNASGGKRRVSLPPFSSFYQNFLNPQPAGRYLVKFRMKPWQTIPAPTNGTMDNNIL
jgi:hypothetical protein